MTSRRAILKSIGLIGLAAAAAPAIERTFAQDAGPIISKHWQGQPYGRISSKYMYLRAEPSTNGEVLETLVQDQIVRVRRTVEGQTVWSHNKLWIETPGGYMYSSYIQPMWTHLPNVPVADLGDGQWAELTVPFSDAYWQPTSTGLFAYRMYYGSTFRVSELIQGEDGVAWYKVEELYQSFYMRASHLRVMPREELAPINPDASGSKWIDIDLTAQSVTAYEGETPVFRHLASTGLADSATPRGTFYIFDKRLSERMVGGRAADEESSERYNLGGVAYTSYFTGDWVALHGCYWHNDYGIRRSNGCVNLPNYAAKWLFRWADPVYRMDELYVRPESGTRGTRVEVHT